MCHMLIVGMFQVLVTEVVVAAVDAEDSVVAEAAEAVEVSVAVDVADLAGAAEAVDSAEDEVVELQMAVVDSGK